jgi:hypothetical protein
VSCRAIAAEVRKHSGEPFKQFDVTNFHNRTSRDQYRQIDSHNSTGRQTSLWDLKGIYEKRRSAPSMTQTGSRFSLRLCVSPSEQCRAIAAEVRKHSGEPFKQFDVTNFHNRTSRAQPIPSNRQP